VSTLDIVAEVLREVAPRAINAKAIVELAGSRLPTASRTPHTVVSRDLAIDLKAKGNSSRFMRSAPGAFLLKEALPTAFYNEIESYPAAWTRNLIEAGELAPGVVDERSIRDLKPADVASYRQFHAFSGIGVWSRALRDAGIPDDFNVWSGSAPCQPFSAAGRKLGKEDERHLWPEWFRLIEACRPTLIFAEQVASKDGLAWLDVVLTDLERADYTVRAIDTCAAGYGAPHLRQRFYIVAYARERGCEILSAPWLRRAASSPDCRRSCSTFDGGASGLLDTHGERREGDAAVHDATWDGRTSHGSGGDATSPSELGDTGGDGDRQHAGELSGDEAQHEEWAADGDHTSVLASATHRPGDRIRIVDDPSWGGAVGGFWARDVEWIYCRPAPGHEDGCFRPAESGTQPLADRTPSGVGRTRTKRLKGYGNAIVRPQAVEFISAVIETFAEAALEWTPAAEVPDSVPLPQAPFQTWTGPRPDEVAPSGMLLGRVPGDRWPHGPPDAHETACNLFPHRGSPGGLFCDCRLANVVHEVVA